MELSEKVELLGKGCYKSIPGELTLKSMPTISELDMVGSEDFEAVMVDKILPSCVEEKINFRELLEIDFQWLCRCLRIMNYGPYYTTNAIICDDCGKTSYGDYDVDLRSIACKPLPEDFTNDLVITKDELIDFNGDIHFHLPTIQETMNAYKDNAFQDEKGKVNRELARICYTITSIGTKKNMTPFEVKMYIQNKLSPADYVVLKARVDELSDYGLRAGGYAQCPKCHGKNAAFVALVDARFFRTSVRTLRKWKHDRSTGEDKNTSGNKTTNV